MPGASTMAVGYPHGSFHGFVKAVKGSLASNYYPGWGHIRIDRYNEDCIRYGHVDEHELLCFGEAMWRAEGLAVQQHQRIILRKRKVNMPDAGHFLAPRTDYELRSIRKWQLRQVPPDSWSWFVIDLFLK